MTDIDTRIEMEIETEISLDCARARADEAADLLTRLRAAHDLAAFEFTRHVRIAPMEIPHSHPVLTLNTRWNAEPDRFLAMYLHEQMHWYLADHRPAEVRAAMSRLAECYPHVPSAAAEGARDDNSVRLHLLVNWLEVSALSTLIGQERAQSAVTPPPTYPWCYAAVRKDWTRLETLFRDLCLAPIPNARKLCAV